MTVSFDLRSPLDSSGEIVPSCDNLQKQEEENLFTKFDKKLGKLVKRAKNVTN